MTAPLSSASRLPAPATPTRVSRYVPSTHEMTEMHKRFVLEFLIDLDATRAAVRSGYTSDVAPRAARALMKFPPVRQAIDRAQAERARRTGINADRVLVELGAVTFGDPASIFNENGGLKKPHEMDQYDRKMIAGVKTRRAITQDEHGNMVPEEITEVKLVDKLSAIGMTMKHLGMLNDKVDVHVHHSLATRLSTAQARLAGKTIDGEATEIVDEDMMLLSHDALANAPAEHATPDCEIRAPDPSHTWDSGASCDNDIDLDYLINGD